MKVALLGFGKAGRQLFEELDSNRLITSILVFDPGQIDEQALAPDKSIKSKFYNDIFRFEHSVDLVVIASPDNLHTEDLVECINRGIPTFVEKPYVSSETQLNYVKSALLANPKYITTCNLVLRSSPLFSALREEFSNGTFGSRVFIEGKYLYGRWSKIAEGWRGYKDYSVILGGLIHLVDIACYITGNFNHEVSIENRRLTSKEPVDIIDFARLSMSSEKTGFFNLSTTFSANVEHRRDISIYGDLSWVEVKGREVDFGPPLHEKLIGLSPAPQSKGALLSEFISSLCGLGHKQQMLPKIEEIFKVTEICLGQSAGKLPTK